VLDVDCTGMSNLYEFAFEANPTAAVPAILVTSMDHTTGNVYLAPIVIASTIPSSFIHCSYRAIVRPGGQVIRWLISSEKFR
jgi:hypothetical protein